MALDIVTPTNEDRVTNLNYSLRPNPSQGNPIFNKWVQDRIPLPNPPSPGNVFQGGPAAGTQPASPINILQAGPNALVAPQKNAAGNVFVGGRTSDLESGLDALQQRSSNPDLYKNESAIDRAAALSTSSQNQLKVATGRTASEPVSSGGLSPLAPTFADSRNGFGFGTFKDRWDPREAGSIARRDAFDLGDSTSLGARLFANTKESDLINRDVKGQ